MAKGKAIKKKFQEALICLVEKEGWGTKARIARKIKVKNSYITELVKGDRIGSEDKRREIASFFGYSYEAFLEIGDRLFDNEDFQVINDSLKSEKPTRINDSDSVLSAVIDKWQFLSDSDKEQVVELIDKIGHLLVNYAQEINNCLPQTQTRAETIWDIAFRPHIVPTIFDLSFRETLEEYIDGDISDIELYEIAKKKASKLDSSLKKKQKQGES